MGQTVEAAGHLPRLASPVQALPERRSPRRVELPQARVVRPAPVREPGRSRLLETPRYSAQERARVRSPQWMQLLAQVRPRPPVATQGLRLEPLRPALVRGQLPPVAPREPVPRGLRPEPVKPVLERRQRRAA